MPVQRIKISEFLENTKDHLLLDVRSPAEFEHAHIPGALNLPLFSNDERKIVGTTYKQQSREQAIKAGLDFFGPKMRPMVETVEQLLNSRSEVYLYCWRGGMRSAGVAWLLDLYGFKVYSLAGGYKSYRKFIIESFSKSYPFKIIGGYTGSGKTEILRALKHKGENVVDLEDLAHHKGSAFGGIGMPAAPSQEMFENRLGMCLGELSLSEGYIWLEDESQRIGNVNIPAGVWKSMRNSEVVFVDIPFAERLDYITNEYGSCTVDRLIEAVERIRKRLGGLDAKNCIEFLQQRNYKEAFSILLKYYDKQYEKALYNREQPEELIVKLPFEKVSVNNALMLKNKIHTL
ncbi:MAG TPA: tRNA 2-selenouridine(34) synthase MnmH [Flavisolibacter sp.]|nr:tRNA 2-selenouridine(34) synthase MnmH [Flavisolibacter sp.]